MSCPLSGLAGPQPCQQAGTFIKPAHGQCLTRICCLQSASHGRVPASTTTSARIASRINLRSGLAEKFAETGRWSRRTRHQRPGLIRFWPGLSNCEWAEAATASGCGVAWRRVCVNVCVCVNVECVDNVGGRGCVAWASVSVVLRVCAFVEAVGVCGCLWRLCGCVWGCMGAEFVVVWVSVVCGCGRWWIGLCGWLGACICGTVSLWINLWWLVGRGKCVGTGTLVSSRSKSGMACVCMWLVHKF